MKVSLIKPPTNGTLGLDMITFAEPLGLECVAGALEAEGHQCLILDLRIDSWENGLRKLRVFGSDLFGIQCNFTTERYKTIELTQRLRNDFPGVPVITGGHDASRDPEWFNNEAITAVAVGDGEEMIPALARAIEEGKDYHNIPGLVLNTSDGQIYTGDAPARENIDELPLPAKHLIQDYSRHYYMSFCKPLALLETSRGCPFRCNFCSVWKFHKGAYREKSTQRVINELKQIDAPYVFITDDIFWLDRDRGKELAKAIKASGIRKHFFLQTRSDIIIRSPDLVEQWKGCGRLTIFLGFEGIDDEELKLVNKKNTVANNDRAIEILQELGVGYTANFIVNPAWDREHFAKLREWVGRYGAYNSGFSILTPLPGTDLWEQARDKLTTQDWNLFDLEHAVLPTRLPLDEFYEEYAGLYRYALGVRHRTRSRLRDQLRLVLALATGRVTLTALRRGLKIGSAMGRATTFLKAHQR